MYERLELENFKAFKDLSLELRPLTLLSGMNGMGKSSIIQSMLLLRQSYLQRTSVSSTEGLSLILNGDLIDLGTGQDVFFSRNDRYAPERFELCFTIFDRDIGRVTWSYEYDSHVSDVLKPTLSPSGPLEESIYETVLFGDEFHYLQAERIGPRAAFSMSDYVVRQRRQLGTAGQYAAHFLQEFGRSHVENKLIHSNGGASTLIAQVTAWMHEISPGTQIDSKPYADMDLMSLRFRFPGTDSFRATNVGFGITYTLPVLVALLSSRPGSLVLLENPEAHLHPKGQVRMGELISRAASAGIQVVVETHSDHVLNGIRIAARHSMLDPDDAALHFFQRPDGEHAITPIEVVTPKLDQDGRIDFWPENFFDEWDKSLDALL